MKKILILIALLNFYNSLIKAQADTLIMKNVSDTITNIEENLKQKQEYLNVNFREEKTLLKLGISPLNFSYNASTTANSVFFSTFIFEQKMSTSWSVIVNNNFSFEKNKFQSDFQYSVDLGIRYYYNLKKRIEQSIGASNFHCNYFSFALEDFYTYKYQKGFGFSQKRKGVWEDPFVSLSWGIQRRIGKWGFVDIGPYLIIGRQYIVGANFIFGLGLGR